MATPPHVSDRPAQGEPTADGETPPWSNRSNDVEQKSVESEETQRGDKRETADKSIVLVLGKSAEIFEISRGGGAAERRHAETPLYGDEWKWANVKWMTREVTDVAATR